MSALRRLALAAALSATRTAQLTARAVEDGLEEVARGLLFEMRAHRDRERLRRSVVRDIERLPEK